MTNFQIAIIGIFLFFILAGVTLFATFGHNGGRNTLGKVEIWGTIDREIMDKMIDDLQSKGGNIYDGLSYKQLDANTFDDDLAEALASGEGPDVFIFPQNSILKHKSKIFPIPYKNYPLRNFKDKFIEEGELFLNSQNILAFPFIIDPMVMYWNRDIFSRNGISNPPKFWDEFFSLSQKITKKDMNLNIFTSLVPFGEFKNVNNAKDIISTLIMQAGSPIVEEKGGKIIVSLDSKFGGETPPAEKAIDFFTQFSNPVKSVYTWHRALPNSEKAFLSGDLAIYFGFASELSDLRAKNPNLNFDVAMMPQAQDKNVLTFGRIYGLAITKNSKNIKGAYQTIQALTQDKTLSELSTYTHLPPVTRSLLAKPQENNSYSDVFYRSALISKAWLDPNNVETNSIFQNMIDTITSGRSDVGTAVKQADAEIDVLTTSYSKD